MAQTSAPYIFSAPQPLLMRGLSMNNGEGQDNRIDTNVSTSMEELQLRTSEAMRVIQAHVDMTESYSTGSIPLTGNALLTSTPPPQRSHSLGSLATSMPTTSMGSAIKTPSSQPLERAPAATVGGEAYSVSVSTTASRTHKLSDRLSPLIQQRIREVFDEVEDRSVLEDRSLMLLLSKIPEPQTLEALQMYERAVQQRGRSTINNPCGYMISLLKKAQQMEKRDDKQLMSNDECAIKQSARPFRTLKPRVRAELEKTFDPKIHRGVLEDVGLMKQLGRLDEDQAVEAISNYREVAGRRGGKSILNPSAYMMVILREYIEGTTPLPAGGSSMRSHSSSAGAPPYQYSSSSPHQSYRSRSEEGRESMASSNFSPSPSGAFDYGFPTAFQPMSGAVPPGLSLPSTRTTSAALSDEPWTWPAGTGEEPVGFPISSSSGENEDVGSCAERLAETARAVGEGGILARQRPQQLQLQPDSSPLQRRRNSSSSLDLALAQEAEQREHSRFSTGSVSNVGIGHNDSEVTAFLSRLGLEKYERALQEAEVDMAALSLFNEKDLRELGLPKGPRIKILHTLHDSQIH